MRMEVPRWAKAPCSTISVGRPTLATAAGLLPAMGYLCPDDALVQCAAVRRLEHPGDQGHYVVLDDPTPPGTAHVQWPAGTP